MVGCIAHSAMRTQEEATMARLFNVEVFNKTISGATEEEDRPKYYTAEEFYALLGSADSLWVQAIVDYQGAATTGNNTVTVALEINNSNEAETWEAPTGVSPVDVPFSETSPAKLTWVWLGTAAHVRFVVTSKYPNVAVRIIVCGRAS